MKQATNRLHVFCDEATLTLTVDGMSQQMSHAQALEATSALAKMWSDMKSKGHTTVTLRLGAIQNAQVTRLELAEGVLNLAHTLKERSNGWAPPLKHILQLLLVSTERLFASEPIGETPLHIAASSGKPEAVREALLLKPDVNARTQPNGFTPLHMGVTGTDQAERQEIVKLLHAAGADLELKTYDRGLTPLQLAAMRGKPLCVAALLQCGANVGATEGNGATALHGAAFNGYVEVCRLLLQAGANTQLADQHGNTPMSLARAKGHTQVCDLLSP